MKTSLPTASIWLFLILVTSLRCQVCRNAIANLQEILQTRQIAGRFNKNTKMLISRQHVVTKMGCLDNCLRTAECGSFDMKKNKKYWLCLINRRLEYGEDKIPRLVKSDSSKGWIHFNVGSQELQEVSSTVKRKINKKKFLDISFFNI